VLTHKKQAVEKDYLVLDHFHQDLRKLGGRKDTRETKVEWLTK